MKLASSTADKDCSWYRYDRVENSDKERLSAELTVFLSLLLMPDIICLKEDAIDDVSIIKQVN
jgi:hypothetical protein